LNKDEAIHKALKVLNCLNNDRVYETAWVKGAINACEEALEQPTVAELNNEYLRDTNVIGLEQPAQEPLTRAQQVIRANNTTQPAQEPVGFVVTAKLGEHCGFKSTIVKKGDKVYTHPHQWQGLTDNEKLASIRKWSENNTMRGIELIGLCDAIEQELRNKNGN